MDSLSDPEGDATSRAEASSFSNFDRFLIANYPPEQWPDRLFSAYLNEMVPPEEWADWYAKRVPADMQEAGWSSEVIALAALRTPAILSSTPTRAQANRMRRKIKRLERDPIVVSERDRLIADDETRPTPGNYFERATAFAAAHPVHGVPPDDVAAYLIRSVFSHRMCKVIPAAADWPLNLPDSQPVAWVNPLPSHVPLYMPPKTVAIIVGPDTTRRDLDAVWSHVEDALKRLGGGAPKSGRPPEKEEMYRRGGDLHQRMGMSWLRAWQAVGKEYPGRAPKTPEALRAGWYRLCKKEPPLDNT